MRSIDWHVASRVVQHMAGYLRLMSNRLTVQPDELFKLVCLARNREKRSSQAMALPRRELNVAEVEVKKLTGIEHTIVGWQNH